MSAEIKGYSILGKIAKGGMGEVYKGIHLGLGKEVILKKLSPNAPAGFNERFRREASIMMDISHPNIVHMYDYFQEGGSPYIAMEYIDGYSLSELIYRYKKIPVYLASYIILKIAEGLKYAHSEGVIHRDIKPGNVLLSASGEIKLTDFGIAFKPENHDAENVTKQGTILGTPAYMSPEQIKSSKDVDARSDLYSLGVLFYEMLTGQRPFTNEFSTDNIKKIMKGKYARIRKFNKNVPFHLVRVIRKMMHHDSNKRYKNADQLIHVISGFLSFRFKDSSVIKKDLALIVNGEDDSIKFTEKGVGVTSGLFERLSQYMYPNFFIGLDFAKVIIFSFCLFLFLFLSIKAYCPTLLLSWLNLGCKYGIVDIRIENRESLTRRWSNSGKILLSVENPQTGRIKRYKMQGKRRYIKRNKIIMRAGEYRIQMKNYDSLMETGFFVKPFKMLPKNELLLQLQSVKSEPVKFMIQIMNEKSGKKITQNVNLSFRELKKKNESWQEFRPETLLYSGKEYEFKASSPGYIDSPSYFVRLSPWTHCARLQIFLSPEKSVIWFDTPPVSFELKINGKSFWYAQNSEGRVQKLFLSKKSTGKRVYCLSGTYSFLFLNRKENIKIEKQIIVPSEKKDIFISFEKDGGGDICVVSRVKDLK